MKFTTKGYIQLVDSTGAVVSSHTVAEEAYERASLKPGTYRVKYPEREIVVDGPAPGPAPVPEPPPAPTPEPPPAPPPARTDAMIVQWIREEMAKVTTYVPTAAELQQGLEVFRASPYAEQTEVQVRAAILAMAQSQFPAPPAPGPAPTPTPVPTPTPPSPSGSLISDKIVRPMTALAKPALLGVVTDPQFGTRIRRITDVAAQFPGSKVCKPAYSTIPAWNCDESRLILYIASKGHVLFDGKTYAFIRQLDIAPADLEHFYWSSTDPDVLFYPFAYEQSGTPIRALIKYRVSTSQKEAVYNFTGGGYRTDFGGDPVYGSYDNNTFGLRCRSNIDQSYILDLAARKESPRGAGDAPQISPSGRFALAGNQVVNAKTYQPIRTRSVASAEHGSFLRLANGQDVWASVQFDGPEGTLVTENLDTGAVETIVGPATGYPYPPTGTHMSGHAFGAPGLLAISVTGNPNGKGLLDQELLLADLNTKRVYRVGRHRSAGGDGPNGYWAEPHVNISPSGKRMVFGSDWGGGPAVDSYVVEL